MRNDFQKNWDEKRTVKKWILDLVRIAAVLVLLFAGGAFWVTKGSSAAPLASSTGGSQFMQQLQFQTAGPFQVLLPVVYKNFSAPRPLWRFGIAEARNVLNTYDASGLASMRFGWYLDYKVTENFATPHGAEYVPTIRVKQLKYIIGNSGTQASCCVGCQYAPNWYISPGLDVITRTAAAHPGLIWQVGNEIDRRDWGIGYCASQDEITPELYAQAYHDIYTALKAADPTAQVAIGPMVEYTDLRQKYLDRVWAEYSRLAQLNGWTPAQMPVDVWNIHLYVLPEKSCAAYPADCGGAEIPAGLDDTIGATYTILDHKNFSLIWDQVVKLRTWMKIHGQQNKPLIITEYGGLMPAWLDPNGSGNTCATYPDTTGCPFSPEAIRDSIMYPSFNAFLNNTDPDLGYPADGNRLVQRWNWFSADSDNGICDGNVFYPNSGGNLFDSGLGPLNSPNTCAYPPLGRAPLGTYWMDYVQGLP